MIDPFETMALQSVSKALQENLSETESMLHENMGFNGVARKFWSVPEELLYEEKGCIIGNIFVLAQVAITQSTILFQRLREYCERKDCLPKQKRIILEFKSRAIEGLNLSGITLIDSVANFFKHQDEWPSNWDSCAKGKYPTMNTVKKIGMTPQPLMDNIVLSLHALGIYDDICSITNIVQKWREGLASELLKDSAVASSVN